MSALKKLFSKVLNNPLLKQSLWSLIARFVGVALNFLVVMIITNQLPKSSAGDILLLMTFITGIALISRLGIDQLLMKEVASAHQEEFDFHEGFFKASLKAVLFLSFIFMALWALSSHYIQANFFFDHIANSNINEKQPNVSITELVAASLGILFFNLVILNSTYLKAIKKTVMGVLGQNALTAITFLVLIGLFWNYFSTDQYVFYIYTASLLLAGVIAIIYTYRSFANKTAITPSTIETPDKLLETVSKTTTPPHLYALISKSLPLAPVSIISFLMIFTDTIMVGWFLANEQVAEYSVASKISYIVLFFLQAMEATIYPRLLNIFSHNKDKLHSFFWQSTALVITVVLSVTVFMYLLSDWILIAFGKEYDVAKSALGLLLIAQLFRAATITFSFMFIIREKVRYLNYILVTAFVVNVVCNIIFIQSHGIEGAAFATLVANATLLVLIIALFAAHKLLTLPKEATQP